MLNRNKRFNNLLKLALIEIKPDLSYSSVMRKLRKGKDEKRLEFQKEFKNAFDGALNENLEEPEKIALLSAIKAINFSNDENAG